MVFPQFSTGIVVTNDDDIVNYINLRPGIHNILEMILKYLESNSDNLKRESVFSNMYGYVSTNMGPIVTSMAYQMKAIETLMGQDNFKKRLQNIQNRINNNKKSIMFYYDQQSIIDEIQGMHRNLNKMFSPPEIGGSRRQNALTKKTKKTIIRRI